MAKRRVENKKSDPNSVGLKYSNNHNHPIPSLMNPPSVSNGDVIGSTKVFPSAPVLSSEENTEDDHIFGGLGEFIDI